jgi:hypothetical protein
VTGETVYRPKDKPRRGRPEGSAAGAANRLKIRGLRAEGYTFAEISAAMGLSPETCESYYRKGVKKGEYEPIPGASPNAITSRNPEETAAVMAAAALEVDDPKFARLREACKEAGLKPTIVAGLIKRLRTTFAGVLEEGRRLTVKEMTEELQKKAHLIFTYMDEYSVSQASLKDLSIALSVVIEKHELLSGRPTQTIDFTTRQQLPAIMAGFAAEARRRGITLDGTATRVESSSPEFVVT